MQIDVGFTTENKYEIAFEFGSKFHWVCYIVNYNMGGFKKVVVCNSLKNPWFLVVIINYYAYSRAALWLKTCRATKNAFWVVGLKNFLYPLCMKKESQP